MLSSRSFIALGLCYISNELFFMMWGKGRGPFSFSYWFPTVPVCVYSLNCLGVFVKTVGYMWFDLLLDFLLCSTICMSIFFINLFLYLSLVALGLRCCARPFSRCGERGLLFVVVHGLLIMVASLVEEHGL